MEKVLTHHEGQCYWRSRETKVRMAPGNVATSMEWVVSIVVELEQE